MQSSHWLIRRPSGSRRLRLYCFPHAGGNATCFAPWQATLDPAIDVCAVQLPGHGSRLNEPLHTSLSVLVETVAQVIIEQQCTLPFAFFGHSMGGLLAFELTRYCMRHSLPMPKHLFVAGCNAPQYRGQSARLHELGDEALIDALRNFNGASAKMLSNSDLKALALPAIRADLALLADYQYHPSPPLDIPITVLAGKLDEHVSPIQTQGWQKETIATCRIDRFEGDHFFVDSDRKAVLDYLREGLVNFIEPCRSEVAPEIQTEG
jgi:surfactin synthase thioesterase subunit